MEETDRVPQFSDVSVRGGSSSSSTEVLKIWSHHSDKLDEQSSNSNMQELPDRSSNSSSNTSGTTSINEFEGDYVDDGNENDTAEEDIVRDQNQTDISSNNCATFPESLKSMDMNDGGEDGDIDRDNNEAEIGSIQSDTDWSSNLSEDSSISNVSVLSVPTISSEQTPPSSYRRASLPVFSFLSRAPLHMLNSNQQSQNRREESRNTFTTSSRFCEMPIIPVGGLSVHIGEIFDNSQEQLPPSVEQSPKCTCKNISAIRSLRPPCYICSNDDQPPKYKAVESSNVNKTNSKIWRILQRFRKREPQQPATSVLQESQDMNGSPFTISDGNQCTVVDLQSAVRDRERRDSLADTSSETSSNSLVIHIQPLPQNEQNSDLNINFHDANRCPPVNAERLGDHPQPQTRNGIPSLRMASSDPPPYSIADGTPPPYSPPTPASIISGYLVQDALIGARTYNPARFQTSRSCQCTLIYSTLLGAVTSVAIFGTDAPLPLMAGSIFFFTFAIYVPVIFAIESLLHCQNRRIIEGRQ